MRFHSNTGWWNRAVDLLVTGLLEFKAFDLFSITFGIGVAIQAERGKSRGVGVAAFLVRRFLILLIFGAAHMALISNVDILTLYAVCGLLLILTLRLPTALLFLAGLVGIYAPPMLTRLSAFPSESLLRGHVPEAMRIYSQAGFSAIVEFRWHETQMLIIPLLLLVAQKSFGLMLLGVAVWRSGILQNPEPYRSLLWIVFWIGGTIGICATSAEVWLHSTGKELKIALVFNALGSDLPLALAYGAGLLAWRRGPRASAILLPVAAAGRMALTNYLTQTIAMALLFYGFGFGLFGRLDPLAGAAIGAALYSGQLWFSEWWLSRYRFGPFEWLWRLMSYGRWQPMRIGRPL